MATRGVGRQITVTANAGARIEMIDSQRIESIMRHWKRRKIARPVLRRIAGDRWLTQLTRDRRKMDHGHNDPRRKQKWTRNVVTGASPMRSTWALGVVLVLFVAAGFAGDGEAAISNGYLNAGVGSVDITPNEPVVLAGSPTQLKSSSVSTRLYVRALVLSAGGQNVAIVTLDTLKYPVEHVVRQRQQIEKTTGIPASNVIICTFPHSPRPAVALLQRPTGNTHCGGGGDCCADLTPCRLGTSKGRAEGVSECRRVIKDGKAWNRWQLEPSEADEYQAEGPADPEFDVLALIGKDETYRAVVYNFACHAANTRDLTVSSDYPGDVQKYVQEHLGYEVPVMFLTGPCGDVNPVYSVRGDLFGEKLGGGIMQCLGQLEPIAKPSLSIESREMHMPGREHPELKDAEIAHTWPSQLEHYRKTSTT